MIEIGSIILLDSYERKFIYHHECYWFNFDSARYIDHFLLQHYFTLILKYGSTLISYFVLHI